MINGMITILWHDIKKVKVENVTPFQLKLVNEIDNILDTVKAPKYYSLYLQLLFLNIMNNILAVCSTVFIYYLFICLATELPRLLIFYFGNWEYIKIYLIMIVVNTIYIKILIHYCHKQIEILKKTPLDCSMQVRQCFNDLDQYKELKIFHFLEKNQHNLLGVYILKFIYISLSEGCLKKTEKLFNK